MKQPGRPRISPTTRSSFRIVMALVITVCAIILMNVMSSRQIITGIIELRKQELRRIVTLGLKSIEPVRQQYTRRTITRDEALIQIRNTIRRLTYDDPRTRNYLFMSSFDGTMLVQPFEPEMEGTNQWDLKDSYSTYIIRELVNQARMGAGYVEYFYPPPDREDPELKISYVAGLEEFGCYLGTGLYVYDARAFLRSVFWKSHLVTLLIFIALGAILFFFFRPYYAAYNILQRRFSAVAQQPEAPIAKIDHSFGENSEVGVLMKNFDCMMEELNLSRDRIRKALDDREILLQEVHHRVKNNLQIISSLLNLQTRYVKDPEHLRLFQESALRIHSMSLVHETIYSSRNYDRIEMRDYIRRLGETIFQSIVHPRITIRQDYQLQEGSLPISKAIICGLILTELITNSLKHGFAGTSGGTLTVVYRQTGKEAFMTVGDDGSGAPEDMLTRETESLGITLVQSLVDQLDGTIALDTAGGCRISVIFPVV